MEDPAQPRIRVMLVDDHAVVRRGLAASISPEPDLEVVATASSGRQAVELFRAHRPDVTVMDLNLTPEMSGTQAIQAIRREFSQARIIVLSAYKGDEDIYSALKAGAATYLLKDQLGDDLPAIIRQVHAGAPPVPSEVGRKLADRIHLQALTPREIQVLELVSKGLRNKEIAAELGITEDTVQDHIESILSKLDVHERSGAIAVAIRRGILRII